MRVTQITRHNPTRATPNDYFRRWNGDACAPSPNQETIAGNLNYEGAGFRESEQPDCIFSRKNFLYRSRYFITMRSTRNSSAYFESARLPHELDMSGSFERSAIAPSSASASSGGTTIPVSQSRFTNLVPVP